MDDKVKLVVHGRRGYFLVVKKNQKKFCLPSGGVRRNEDFMDVAHKLLNKVLGAFGYIEGIVRIQRGCRDGSSSTPVLTVVFLMEVSGECQPPIEGDQKWLAEDELARSASYVDPFTWKILDIVGQKQKKKEAFCPCEVLECVLPSMKGKNSNQWQVGANVMERSALEDQMFIVSGYGVNELKQVEDLFVRYCGSASGLMNVEQFSLLLVHLGFVPELCQQCYGALLSGPEAEGLALREVQIGLCCLDPSTLHGGLSAQFRCQFIFRFYKGGKDRLYFKEFRQLVKDIYSFKKIVLKEAELEKAVMDNWKIFSMDESQGISLDTFLNVVGQLRFRGTSVLFRLPHPPVNRQNAQMEVRNEKSLSLNGKAAMATQADSSEQAMEEMETGPSISVSTPDGEPANGSFLQDFSASNSLNFSRSTSEVSGTNDSLVLPEMEYSIATHFVKVKRSGTLTDVTTLWDLVGTDAMSGSMDHLMDVRPGFERLPSINAFDRQSKSNEMLSGLRYFEHALKDNGRGKPKNQFSWGAVDMVSVARCFIQICAKAIDIFSTEMRLLEVDSPCYVLGDLHGNFHDLVCFEKVLWRMGPVLTPASFLFLGDYVDRGPHGFEVVAYLFAQKLLMPAKFQLIRGNHEIRAVQEAFTFKQECLDKFGEDLGLEVWEAANSAFDAMPVAAIIDKKVFCVHGGIPMPSLEGKGMVSAINDIPGRLANPVEQSPLAWDMLWNDPIRQEEIDEDIEVQLQENGFIENFARGTAHMFSNKALEEFLARNQLSHVIRAHECKASGFQIQHQGRLLTVFSSSHYCGATNEAACVLVDNKKIRTIRLDTT